MNSSLTNDQRTLCVMVCILLNNPRFNPSKVHTDLQMIETAFANAMEIIKLVEEKTV